MAFFPDVTRGDKFKPNALLSNNVRHIVNAMNGFSAKPLFATGGMIRIQVYNNTSTVIAAGTAVNFSEDGSLCDDAVPAEPLKDAAKPWGVTVNSLKANAMGSCILCGPANVMLSGSGDYAEPSTSNPASFTRGSTGAPVIFAANGKGVILLGAGNQAYNGPFAVSYDSKSCSAHIAEGHCEINISEFTVAETTVDAAGSGFIILESEYGSNTISAPQIKFQPGRPSPEYRKCKVALAKITVKDGNASVIQLHYGDIYAVMWGNCEQEES